MPGDVIEVQVICHHDHNVGGLATRAGQQQGGTQGDNSSHDSLLLNHVLFYLRKNYRYCFPYLHSSALTICIDTQIQKELEVYFTFRTLYWLDIYLFGCLQSMLSIYVLSFFRRIFPLHSIVDFQNPMNQRLFFCVVQYKCTSVLHCDCVLCVYITRARAPSPLHTRHQTPAAMIRIVLATLLLAVLVSARRGGGRGKQCADGSTPSCSDGSQPVFDGDR